MFIAEARAEALECTSNTTPVSESTDICQNNSNAPVNSAVHGDKSKSGENNSTATNQLQKCYSAAHTSVLRTHPSGASI